MERPKSGGIVQRARAYNGGRIFGNPYIRLPHSRSVIIFTNREIYTYIVVCVAACGGDDEGFKIKYITCTDS